MKKYDFDSMGALWADRAREIVKNGIFVANSGGWDLWAYDGTVYAIPVKGSSGSASYWCALSQLRAHLFRLRTICRYNSLIPDYLPGRYAWVACYLLRYRRLASRSERRKR